MRIRIKKYRKRRSKKRGRGIPYIYQNRVYLGKKQKRAGIVSKTLAHILQGVGDVIGLLRYKIS